jgi:hypothetical protein
MREGVTPHTLAAYLRRAPVAGRLLRLDYAVPPQASWPGDNAVQIRLAPGAPPLQLEKLEVHVEYH